MILHISATCGSQMTSDLEPFSKETDSQERCALFALPPELRNIIFELVHTTAETNDDGTLDLWSTKPPTKYLALACQKLSSESYALFKAAFRTFWDHEFTIVISTPPTSYIIPSHHCNVSESNLARINSIKLVCRPNGLPGAIWVVHLNRTSPCRIST